MTKLPIKKVTNCSPYFTALQHINNLETKRSYKRKVNQDVYKTANKSASTHTNQTLLSSNRLELSPMIFTHAFKKKLKLLGGEIAFLQITAKQQYCPFFTVFLTIKTLSQNISITLLQISLKLHEHRGCYWRKKLP